MPKVPKIKVFFLFYKSKIDQTEGCSETLAHFRSLHTLDHFPLLVPDPRINKRINNIHDQIQRDHQKRYK